VTEFLPAEADDALRKEWTDNPCTLFHSLLVERFSAANVFLADWHTVDLYSTMLYFVGQLSSRVFLGPELCRDANWRRITIDHAVSSFTAAAELRSWPAFLRPIVHWFLPRTRALRAQVADARQMLGPVIEKRKREMAHGGHSQDRIANAIAWFEDIAANEVQYDPVAAQLILSVASVHSTADLLCQAMIDLCGHPDLFEPLRREVIAVVGQHGWTKSALHNLKLMDSVLKESQRLKPIATGMQNIRSHQSRMI
jgi:cytochrome P450